MKELSTVIEITHIRSGEVTKVLAEQFVFEPLIERGAPGILYNCSKDINIEKVDKSIRDRFATTQSCIVKFKDNKGQFYTIGTNLMPAKVTINNYLDSDLLSLESKMTTNPLNV